jgi:hypothetical protein
VIGIETPSRAHTQQLTPRDRDSPTGWRQPPTSVHYKPVTQLKIPRNRRISRRLGAKAVAFLESAANSIGRILPHAEAYEWRIGPYRQSDATFDDPSHRQINITIGIGASGGYSITCKVRRRMVPTGVGAIARTLHPRERDICDTVVTQLAELFPAGTAPSDQVMAVAGLFDELVVARHLKETHGLQIDSERVFSALRSLAEQTYENRPLAFGCIIDAARTEVPDVKARFPEDFLAKKRFRALSDAYYTAYLVSGNGAVVEFLNLPAQEAHPAPRSFFPEWCRDLAIASRDRRVGIALTRNGDVLVFDGGTLRFTYRFGRWQYWNHTHLVDLLKNSARVQHVPRQIVPRVTAAIYRAALDVSFRRSGGMFVIVRNKNRLSDLVRAADQIGNDRRAPISKQFDTALPPRRIQQFPRTLIVELAALDGAIVLSNQGELLAYGAVLEPKRRGKVDAEEGSRTKAAIGASNYGLVIKVSSDGDLTVYVRGREFIRV